MILELLMILGSILVTCLAVRWAVNGKRAPRTQPRPSAGPSQAERQIREHFARHYAGAWHQGCHYCGRQFRDHDQLVDEWLDGQLEIQVFTGRVFCSTADRPCWAEYLKGEGLA